MQNFSFLACLEVAELCRGAEKHTRGMEKRARIGEGMEKPTREEAEKHTISGHTKKRTQIEVHIEGVPT